MLKKCAGQNPPKAKRIDIHRQLVELLSSDKQQRSTVEQYLRQLAEEDPARSGDYWARLILLYERQDTNKEREGVTKIDIDKVTDARLLDRASDAIVRYESSYVEPIIRRLLELDPRNTSYWERYLAMLVYTDREAELCASLRRLIAGVDRMPLSEQTQANLRGYLLDSCCAPPHWR